MSPSQEDTGYLPFFGDRSYRRVLRGLLQPSTKEAARAEEGQTRNQVTTVQAEPSPARVQPQHT